MFLFLAEAILSGGSEGYLSSEGEENDDEHDLSKGRWCFCVLGSMSCNGLYVVAILVFVQPYLHMYTVSIRFIIDVDRNAQ